MSPQKPVKKAYQQQPEVVRNWLDKEYPRIARKAARETAEILWGDEMGVRSNDLNSLQSWKFTFYDFRR